MKSDNRGSYVIFILSMLIYGTIGIFRKFIPLSSGLLVFARGLIGGVFLLALMLIKGRGVLKFGIEKRKALVLMLTGFAIGINWILLFEAYRFTSVSVATLCYYMQPTLLILCSPFVFGERITPQKGVCAAASVIGMVFISGVIGADHPLGKNDAVGIALGLGAALFYTMVIILNKKTPVDNVYGKTTVELFSAAFILLPYLLLTDGFSGVSLDATSVVMILVVGILHTGMAYAMYFGSMGKLSSQTVAVLSYIDPILALILSFAVLGETMSPIQVIGAVMIIGAAILSEITLPQRTWKKARKE